MNRVIRKAGLLAAGFLAMLSMSAHAQTYFSEDFTGASGTIPPTGWTKLALAGGGIDTVWNFSDPTPAITGGGFSAPYAILDSDGYGFGATQIAALTTPVINLSAATAVKTVTLVRYLQSKVPAQVF